MSRRLGDICRVQGGYAFKSRDFGSKGVPVIKISDVTGGGVIDYSNMQCVPINIAGQAKRFAAEPRDTLISMTGANVGKTARTGYADPEAMINQRVGRFVPDAGAGYSKDFIHYVVSSPAAYEYFANAAYGSAQPNISSTLIESLPIPSYSASIANGIGRALSSLDDKIELNRRMNETLEAMAQAIFRDWFVDFGPTRRKLEGATDPVTILGGLVTDPVRAQELADLFPATLGDNGLPEGWVKGLLSDWAISTGGTVAPSQINPETPYIGLEHMPRRSLALSEWEAASKVTSNKSTFSKGQILFGKLRPYFHKVGVAPVDGVCSTDIVVIEAKAAFARPMIAACVSTDEFVAFTDQTSTGTKMPRTSWKLMESFPLARATDEVVAAYSKLAAPMVDKIMLGVHESRTLAATRDLLLPKLMSGKIRPGEAQAVMEAAQ